MPGLPAAHVLAAVLRTTRQCRNGLAGIQQPRWVERLLDREERLALGCRELHAHGVELLDSDAVLAGHRAANADAQLQDLGAEVIGSLPLPGLVGIEKDERMQIPVARVEDVQALQAILALHLRDGPQHLAEFAARDGAVHAVIVRREAPRRGKSVLSSRPEAQP